MATKQNIQTPWGIADNITIVAPGITLYETPSHGGYKLDNKRNKLMPLYMREEDGWYEEDCAYNKVVMIFRKHFTQEQYQDAKRGFANWYPEEYELFFLVTLHKGESYIKDENEFYDANKDNYVVYSAVRTDNNMIKVHAAKNMNKNRHNLIDEKVFLVPKKEYNSHRFIVDPQRHQEIKE